MISDENSFPKTGHRIISHGFQITSTPLAKWMATSEIADVSEKLPLKHNNPFIFIRLLFGSPIVE